MIFFNDFSSKSNHFFHRSGLGNTLMVTKPISDLAFQQSSRCGGGARQSLVFFAHPVQYYREPSWPPSRPRIKWNNNTSAVTIFSGSQVGELAIGWITCLEQPFPLCLQIIICLQPPIPSYCYASMSIQVTHSICTVVRKPQNFSLLDLSTLTEGYVRFLFPLTDSPKTRWMYLSLLLRGHSLAP